MDVSCENLYDVRELASNDETTIIQLCENKAKWDDKDISLSIAIVNKTAYEQLLDLIAEDKYRNAARLLKYGSQSIQHVRNFKDNG